MGKTNWKAKFDEIGRLVIRILNETGIGSFAYNNRDNVQEIMKLIEYAMEELNEYIRTIVRDPKRRTYDAVTTKENEGLFDACKSALVKIQELERRTNRLADDMLREKAEENKLDWRPDEYIGEDYYSSLPEEAQTNAFQTDKPRVISHMPIPPLLQSDSEFSGLMATGNELGAADRAEKLGSYALAHAMRRDATHEEGKADVGLMVNTKNLDVLIQGWQLTIDRNDFQKLRVICDGLEERGYRKVEDLRQWIDHTENQYRDTQGPHGQLSRAAFFSDRSHLRRKMEEADTWYGQGGKSMGSSFLSKNFKLPKVRRGILHSR